MSDKLQPVRHNDIQLGMPLAWSVYDKSGRLLLREGAMVESTRQLEGLSENGLFRRGGGGMYQGQASQRSLLPENPRRQRKSRICCRSSLPSAIRFSCRTFPRTSSAVL